MSLITLKLAVGDVGSTLFQAICPMRENVLLIAPSVTDGQNLQELFEHSLHPRLMLNSVRSSQIPTYMVVSATLVYRDLLCASEILAKPGHVQGLIPLRRHVVNVIDHVETGAWSF
jgi:hypothetical protein